MGLMAAEEALNLNDSLRHRFEVLDATKHEWIYAQLALKEVRWWFATGAWE